MCFTRVRIQRNISNAFYRSQLHSIQPNIRLKLSEMEINVKKFKLNVTNFHKWEWKKYLIQHSTDGPFILFLITVECILSIDDYWHWCIWEDMQHLNLSVCANDKINVTGLISCRQQLASWGYNFNNYIPQYCSHVANSNFLRV